MNRVLLAIALLLFCAPAHAQRTILGGNQVYTIKSSGGGDFAGFGQALSFLSRSLDLALYSVVFKVGCGSYPENLILPSYLGANNSGYGQVIFTADCADPTQVKLNPSAGVAIFSASNPFAYIFQNMWLECPAGIVAEADSGGTIAIDGVTLGPAQIHAQSLFTGSRIVFINNTSGAGGYTVAGDVLAHWSTVHGDIINQPNLKTTFSGTRTIGTLYQVGIAGFANIAGSIYAGSFTGKKYSVDTNSSIYANGGNPNTMIPGTINGP